LENWNGDRSARYLFYLIVVVWGVGVVSTLIRTLAPLLFGLPVLLGWWVWRQQQRLEQQQQETLKTAFYELLQEQTGRLMLLDLAMRAKVPASDAQAYLDARATEFAAQFEVSDAGDICYVFPTLRSRQLSASRQVLTEPNPDSPATALPRSLTQAALAKRLGVSASTLSRKKLSADLTEWSRSRDPDGLGWAYLLQVQRFVAVD
jgi:hypothetical protein